MKKQNLFKSILAMSVVLSMLLFSMTAYAADAVTFPIDGNYTFLNVAYSSDADIYVAVAKDLTDTANTPMKVLVSSNGYSWSLSRTFAAAKNYLKDSSRQILTYWDKEKVFIACAGREVLYSADGMNWTNFVTANEAATVTVFNNKLVLNERGVADDKSYYYFREFNSLNAEDFIQIEYPFASYQYRRYIAVNEEGYFVSDIQPSTTAYATYIKKDGTTTTIYPSKIDITTSITYLPYCDKNIAAVNTTKIRTIKGSISGEITVTLPDGENTSVITAVGYAGGKTYLGTRDGKIYYASEITDITNNTVWNVLTNKSSNTEEIKAFTQGKNGAAVAVSSKSIFLVYSNYYKNINEYSSINVPTVTGGNIFTGVRLFGGAYAPSKGYVVYGNSSDGHGKVYYSEDGIKWKNVMTTALSFNKDQNGNVFKTDNCIYWENKGLFIINLGGNSVGTCYYSFDGKKWDFSQSIPTATSTGSIGLGQNSNIAVNGDYIYTADPVKKQAYFKTTVTVETDPETNEPKIISHSTESIVGSTSIPTAGYGFAFIAVSDETVPYVFLNGGYGVAYGCGGATNTETGRFSFISTGGDKLNVAKWDNSINKFVGVRADMGKIYVFGKDLNPSSLTPSFTDKNIVSFDNNGTKYVFGTSDGSLVSLNSSEITTATAFTAVSAANGVNNLPISSVIAGDGKFIAVATDETDSDIIIVNAEGTKYEKASEKADIVFGEGKTAVVTVGAVNNSSDPINFKMITAIYDGDKLVQTAISDKTVTASFNGYITEEITFNGSVNSNCKMKIYMWDSIDSMKPICEATPFFQ